jgi:uncharacterized protein (TIGR03435 family)
MKPQEWGTRLFGMLHLAAVIRRSSKGSEIGGGMVRCGVRGLVAAVWLGTTVLAFGQDTAATAAPAFDVVTVRPVDPNAKILFTGLQYTPDGIHAGHMSLGMLIRAAYGGFTKLPTEDSVSGLPDWARTEAFDVQAKMSPEQAAVFAKLSKEEQETQREAMLQSMLEDRFKLKVHREPKRVPDYELVVAKGGPKFKESDAPDPNGPKDKDGKPIAGSYLMMKKMGQVTAQAIGMESFAGFLGQGPMGVGRMVADKTGLPGKYSFSLNWSMDSSMGSATYDGIKLAQPVASDDSGPSIFTALQEQLGLKMQPGTGTIDTVVVDHVERPAAD